MKNFIFYILLALLSSNCTPTGEKASSTASPALESSSRRQLVLPVGAMTSNSPRTYDYFSPDKGKTEFLYVMTNDNKLVMYNIHKSDVLDTIHLKTSGPHAVGNELHRSSLYVHTPDSIFITVPLENQVSLIDNQGNLLKKYASLPKGFEPIQTSFLPSTPTFVYEGDVYSSLSYHTDYNAANAADGKEMFKYNLKTGELHRDVLPYSSPYFKYPYPYIMLMENAYTLGKEGTVIRSFPSDPFVYVQKVNNNKVTKVKVQSKYFSFTDTLALSDKKRGQDIGEFAREEYVKTSEYADICYDPYRDKYYRFCLHGIKVQENNTSIPKSVVSYYYKKPLSIITMNSDFTVQSETEILSKQAYNHHLYFISKEGLWLSLNFPHKSNIDEDKMVFELFEL